MKKSIRIVSIVALLCLLCLTLSGCQVLEDARLAHGFWIEEGEHFRLGDSEYIRLPESGMMDFLYVEQDGYRPDIYVTTEDVPVLLSSTFGVAFTSSSDGRLCINYEVGYFCRSDCYVALVEQLVNGFELAGYCYNYYIYDEESYDLVEHTYRLTDEEVAAVDAVLKEGKATVIPAVADVDYDYGVELMSCDESMLFRTYEVDVCSIDGAYYILGSDGEERWSIPVSMPYTTVFDSIMKAPREQYEEETSWYEEDDEYDT